MSLEKYLLIQKNQFENEGNQWSISNRDHVVGVYDSHNNFSDYDNFLFKTFDTKELVALEYGCGPARNIIKFNDRFKRIDGVDISESCIEKAKINLLSNNLNPNKSNLFVCDGQTIPTNDNIYDVVFSVICLQHIISYNVRLNILKEVFRVLKKDGYFCFQMGFGGRGEKVVDYYDDVFASFINSPSYYDVAITNEKFLIDDLINKIGFKNYKSDIRDPGPGDTHKNWIWVQVQK